MVLSKPVCLSVQERLKQKEEWIKLMASGDLDVAEKRLKEIIAEATADGFIDEDEQVLTIFLIFFIFLNPRAHSLPNPLY
jgi:hypothetical protein